MLTEFFFEAAKKARLVISGEMNHFPSRFEFAPRRPSAFAGLPMPNFITGLFIGTEFDEKDLPTGLANGSPEKL